MPNQIIDFHAHAAFYKLYSDNFIDGIVKNLSVEEQHLDKKFIKRIINQWLSDEKGNRLLRCMDEAGIQKSILLIVDFGCKKEAGKYCISDIYDYHFNLTQNCDRFIVFAGIDPTRGEDGKSLFIKSVEKYNFRGLKLYPPCGFKANDKKLYVYYDICSYYGLPVLLHTGPSLPSFIDYIDYEDDISLVISKYPNLKFILGHGGIKQHEIGVKLAHKYENVYVDISSFQSEYLNEGLLKQKLRYSFDNAPNKILFGTDWPMFNFLHSQKYWIDFIEKLNVLSAEELEKLYYKNALKVLNL